MRERGGGGGYFRKDQIQNPEQFLILVGGGGRGGLRVYSWLTKNRINLGILTQNLLTQASSCITDSLSHTMCVWRLARDIFSVQRSSQSSENGRLHLPVRVHEHRQIWRM